MPPTKTRITLTLALIIIVAAVLITGLYLNSENNPGPSPRPEEGVVLGNWSFFNGWTFVVVEHDDVLTENLEEILSSKNISASVVKYGSLSMLNNTVPQKPLVVIVNLLDTDILEELNTSNKTIDTARKLMLGGSYVLFVTNDSNTLQRISKSFNPPLSVPSSKITMTITITKKYKNGRTEEAIVQNLLVVTGRTYKHINGRLIPIGVGATVHIEGSDDNIMQKALQNALIAIIEDEINISSHKG